MEKTRLRRRNGTERRAPKSILWAVTTCIFLTSSGINGSGALSDGMEKKGRKREKVVPDLGEGGWGSGRWMGTNFFQKLKDEYDERVGAGDEGNGVMSAQACVEENGKNCDVE